MDQTIVHGLDAGTIVTYAAVAGGFGLSSMLEVIPQHRKRLRGVIQMVAAVLVLAVGFAHDYFLRRGAPNVRDWISRWQWCVPATLPFVAAGLLASIGARFRRLLTEEHEQRLRLLAEGNEQRIRLLSEGNEQRIRLLAEEHEQRLKHSMDHIMKTATGMVELTGKMAGRAHLKSINIDHLHEGIDRRWIS
jgi:hypothetical protein